jgi:SAM-dependent methyltransferase
MDADSPNVCNHHERSDRLRVPWTVFPGLLLLTAATLLLEVVLTRVLSVTLWYPFAFMVVSTALFGFGFAGVLLALGRNAARPSSAVVAAFALAAPIAFAGGYWLFNHVPFEPFSLGSQPIQWLYLTLAYLSVTMPFFAAGGAIAALLSRYAATVHRLYLFDLLGAGVGSVVVVLLLPWLGGSGTVLAAALLAAFGAIFLTWQAGRAFVLTAGAIGVLLLLVLPVAGRVFPVRISEYKVTGGGAPVAQVLNDPRFHLFTEWNTLSRIDVIQTQRQCVILIDAGTAVTRLAHPEQPIESLGPTGDEETFFVRRRSHPQVLVVGSGGGREVLLAVRNGAARVIAVEINPTINEIVTARMAYYTGYLYQHPRVTAIVDEARSYVRRSTEHFDVIHLPHTISNAALASGSLSLSENHLMTREAFEDYLTHLTPDGVVVITRPEAHLPRLFATIRTVSDARSDRDLAQRLLAWRASGPGQSFYAGLAWSNKPFAPEDVSAFEQLLLQRNLVPLFLPGRQAAAPYGAIVTAQDPLSVPVPFPAILEPATDDSPFFNRRVALSELRLDDLLGVFSEGVDARLALEDRPVAEAALLVLLIQVTFLSVLFIVMPLLLFRRRALVGTGRLRTLLAFCFLGLAYIVVEVGLIQRLTLYLGRPVVVFSTVLGTLLICSGLGSAWSQRLTGATAPFIACLVAGSCAGISAVLFPTVVSATLAWSEIGRIVLAVVMLAPLGFVMGMPFPLMVRRLQTGYPERVSWAWGINGFASVVGSIVAVLCGMTLGYTAVFAVGVLAYLVAAVSVGTGAILAARREFP